jgi:hypothetical protein
MDIPALDGLYFEWLYSQVADPENEAPPRSWWKLLREFFTTEFKWSSIETDENRLQDGKALRLEFIRTMDLHGVDPEWMNIGCSVLELVMGLSRHMAFMTDEEAHYWFWVMVANLGLQRHTDAVFDEDSSAEIEAVLDHFIKRRYLPTGEGGLFPLHEPHQDQRDVELWYQMSAYILEIDDQ